MMARVLSQASPHNPNHAEQAYAKQKNTGGFGYERSSQRRSEFKRPEVTTG